MSEEQRAAVLRELSAGRSWQGEVAHTRRDGTPILVEATAMPLYDESGRLSGFVTVNRDITERKKAEDEIRASREQLRALSRRLVTMQEAERSYVADQLFNQAGQVLAALQMQLARLGREGGRESPAEQLPRMQAMLQVAIGELHDLARELRPVGLDRSTLAHVLAAYLNEFGKAHGLAVELQAGGGASADAMETLRVPADVGTAVFRCAQEALTNVARHARASKVVLSLTAHGDNLVVTLADNGVGLGARVDAGERGPGLGLAGMRERLEAVGGDLTILSGKSGTTLTIQAPLTGAVRDR
jgi:signal transduction histidine kinase